MGKPIHSHGLKYLALASVVVFAWFTWRLSLHQDAYGRLAGVIPSNHPDGYRHDGKSSTATMTTKKPPTPSETPSETPTGTPSDTPSDTPSHSSHPDILDEAAAEQYCSNFRMKPFPRDRVKQRKIYDLLLVNTELEMLEIRMGQMSPGVDYFVVLESDRTFTDQPKPLHVQENMDRFKSWRKQIIRKTMDLTKGNLSSTWDREKTSRNAMYEQVIPYLEGEQEAHLDDVLLVSDVDEMFKPETLKLLRNCAIPDKVTTQSGLFYYSFQWLCEANWPHPQATVYKGEKDTILPDELRQHTDAHHTLRESAWHCSYCFPTIGELVKKITSFSHTELNKAEFKDPEKILYRVRNGHDLFERHLCTRVENNPDVPNFIKENSKRFGYLLDRDPANGNFMDYPQSK